MGKSKGILYGVSTGPGDPELMTIKAVRCLERCEVIAAPRTRGRNSMALDIVKRIIDIDNKVIIYLDFTMSKDKSILFESHKKEAALIEEYLQKGIDVAMLNIGDAALYGPFGYIRDIVEMDGYKTNTIAGVTSFSAVAAELGQSLTEAQKPLTIIPGAYGQVENLLGQDGTKVIMKSGRALSEVKKILADKNMIEEASMVANCGLDNQRVYQNISQSADDEGYFVTILVR